MEKDLDDKKELQLLPLPPRSPPILSSSSRAFNWFHHPPFHPPGYQPLDGSANGDYQDHNDSHSTNGPSLDLELSISLEPVEPSDFRFIETLKLQAAEQIRLAAIEKAYAARVKELTRKEIELAQSEFARARAIWNKTKEEAYKAERLRDTATTCMGEITCYSCRKRFRPC